MPLVFLVTAGSHSEYGICGVYSTIALAEAALVGWSDARIEYHVLDDANEAYGPWCVSLRRNGDVLHADRTAHPDRTSVVFNGGQQANLLVWARTKEQAIKAANERRARLIADGRWAFGARIEDPQPTEALS